MRTWKVSAFQDHGWQLGEKGEWGKHANYELAVHVPLMIRGKIAMLSRFVSVSVSLQS